MKKYILLLATASLMMMGCKKETELKKSVFISDPESPDLPIYSEWGYNTFGAYYERAPFVSNNSDIPVKVIVTNNLTSFVFAGSKDDGSYSGGDKLSITFQISNFLPQEYQQLMTLNDSTLDLKNPAYKVFITTNNSVKDTATILSGSLYFKRLQNLIVDTKQIEVIMSGYFEFKALIKNNPVSISEGRFDVGIGSDNFYVY